MVFYLVSRRKYSIRSDIEVVDWLHLNTTLTINIFLKSWQGASAQGKYSAGMRIIHLKKRMFTLLKQVLVISSIKDISHRIFFLGEQTRII